MEFIEKKKKVKKPMMRPIETNVEIEEIKTEVESTIESKEEPIVNLYKIEFEPFEHTLDTLHTYCIQLTSEKDYTISIRDHIHHGEVYLVHNKVNNKIYIGQAQCYSGRDNHTWGTFGRWKSHLNETFNATKDHCKKLNNAIRKYKPESFEVFMLVRLPMSDIDEMEVFLIDYFDSMGSNGYNMRTGGKKGKDSDETRICKSESKQIRPRDFAFIPIPIEEETPIVRETPKMIEKINKKIYRMEKDRIQNDLIFPIVENKKILGYRVEGLTHQERPVQHREFVGCRNRWNLNQAKRFIKQIQYYNEKKIKIDNPHLIDINRDKAQSGEYYLPEYIQIYTSPYGVSGFKINGFRHPDYKHGKITVTFVDKTKSKDDNYQNAIAYLEGLKNGTIQHEKKISMEKETYKGNVLPSYVSPIYEGKKESGKMCGFCINRFPKSDGSRFRKNFHQSSYGSLDKAFEEVMKEIERLNKEKAEELSK